MTEILKLKIEQLIYETPEAITLILKEVSGREVNYLPGQFLTLLININGKELRRSYSLCSAPKIDPFLAITIKRIVNGEVSRYLIDNLEEGNIIESLPPSGRFTLPVNEHNERDIFLIGAGSGVTPLFSILKSALYNEPLSKVTFIDVNRNEKTTFYWRQLNELKKQFKTQLEIIHLLSEPGPELKKLQGRLNIGYLEQLVKRTLKLKKEDTKFFVCGPFEFMRMVRMTLIYMGFGEEQIYVENFISKSAYADIPPPNFPDQKVKVLFKEKHYQIIVPSGKTILDAALAEGIPLPYSCRAGICSACAGLCKQGNVKMFNNQVLTEREIKTGLVLTCVGYPENENVIIQFN